MTSHLLLKTPTNSYLHFLFRLHISGAENFLAYQNSVHRDESLLITEDVAAREVTLPLYPAMSNDDIITIAHAVSESLQESTIF